MDIDKKYCMSSYLTLRTIYDHNKTFAKDIFPVFFEENKDRENVFSSFDLFNKLKKHVNEATKNGKAALALSGGIDSAILAKFMPKGSTAYTFKCIVPGIDVVDETKVAEKYAKECGLNHKIIEIYWEDFEKFTPILMKHKGAPIHSIEVQIYKAALQAKKDGFDTLIFGESADVNYGGQDGLLSKDWTVQEYIERYSYVNPKKVLKEPVEMVEPFYLYSKNGLMNVHEFNRHVYYCESIGSYINATKAANIKCCAPYSKTYMGIPLDLKRIRKGENKYLVREVFKILYPDFESPKKIPMPRPMNEWLQNWEGPTRPEFIENIDMSQFSGDQKWLLWCLERFLNNIDNRCNA